MKFSVVFIFAVLVCIFENAIGLEYLIGTEIQKCLNCMCHARSGCWSRINCARYSVSKEYWIRAGSHTDGAHTDSDQAYAACMRNENCILNTLKSYTDLFGSRDCNCDGQFDCKDRLAIHLFGDSCFNPKYGDVYSRRFNDCAAQVGVNTMSSIEGDCEPEVF